MESRRPRKDLTTVLVEDFPLGTLEEKLEERFQEFGTIFEIRIVKRDEGNREYALISYEDYNNDVLDHILKGKNARKLDFEVSKNHIVMLHVKSLGFLKDEEEDQRRKILIYDLPTRREVSLEEDNIKDVFAPFGKIQKGSTRVVRISNKNKTRVVFYATLVFEEEESVRKVLERQKYMPFDILGYCVNVSSADKKQKEGAFEKQHPWGQEYAYSYPESHMLFAQLIPLWVSEETLEKVFSEFGPVESVRIGTKKMDRHVEPNNGRMQNLRAFAFITFVEEEAVHKALNSGKSVILPESGELIPIRQYLPRAQSSDRNHHFDQFQNKHMEPSYNFVAATVPTHPFNQPPSSTTAAIRNPMTKQSKRKLAHSRDTANSGASVPSRMSSESFRNYVRDLDRFAGLGAPSTPMRPPRTPRRKSTRREQEQGCCTIV